MEMGSLGAVTASQMQNPHCSLPSRLHVQFLLVFCCRRDKQRLHVGCDLYPVGRAPDIARSWRGLRRCARALHRRHPRFLWAMARAGSMATVFPYQMSEAATLPSFCCTKPDVVGRQRVQGVDAQHARRLPAPPRYCLRLIQPPCPGRARGARPARVARGQLDSGPLSRSAAQGALSAFELGLELLILGALFFDRLLQLLELPPARGPAHRAAWSRH